MSDFRRKTVLITGGASGLGRLLGRMVLEEGASQLIIWDRDEALLATTLQELKAAGLTANGYVVDVTDLTQVQKTLNRMKSETAEVDILFNNAGIVVGKTFVEHSHEEIDRTLHVNTTALMHLARELLPAMLSRSSGHIVNIASAAGMVANPKMSVYCASKWAVIGWSDSLRIELEQAKSGVKVTTATPYYISTGMFEGVRSPVIPILKPEAAARGIIRAVKRDQIFVRMPKIIDLLPLVRGILPVRLFDLVVGRWMGVYHSMSTFTGRKR